MRSTSGSPTRAANSGNAVRLGLSYGAHADPVHICAGLRASTGKEYSTGDEPHFA